MSLNMFLKPTTAMKGLCFFKICRALVTRSPISWAVITISTTGISVYCLIRDAWRPLAMRMVAPAAIICLASITVSSVFTTRISWISYCFSWRMLWAW